MATLSESLRWRFAVMAGYLLPSFAYGLLWFEEFQGAFERELNRWSFGFLIVYAVVLIAIGWMGASQYRRMWHVLSIYLVQHAILLALLRTEALGFECHDCDVWYQPYRLDDGGVMFLLMTGMIIAIPVTTGFLLRHSFNFFRRPA